MDNKTIATAVEDLPFLELAVAMTIPEGLTLGSRLPDGATLDAERVAAHLATLWQVSRSLLRDLGPCDATTNITLEAGTHVATVNFIDETVAVVLVFSSGVPLGMMRVYARQVLSRLQSAHTRRRSADEPGEAPGAS